MGAVGGGIWYGIKGARNSPRVWLQTHLDDLLSDGLIHRVNDLSEPCPP